MTNNVQSSQMLKILLSLLGMIITWNNGMAQNYQPPIHPKQIMQSTVPVNPDVATLGRYMMSPPSLSNGLPQQQVPLFEIREKGLSYPVNLFYSYSGFKLKEEAGSIGLGWGVTDGSIIRIVKHIPDEHHNLMKKFEDFGNEVIAETGPGYSDPTYHISQGQALTTFNYTYNRLFYKLYDAQPDLYIYNVAGYSGKFLWINGQAVMLEHNDVVITRPDPTNPLRFVLTTPEGVECMFDPADKTWQTVFPITTANVCGASGPLETFVDYGYHTSWKLKQIKSKITQSKISFIYTTNLTTQIKDVDQLSSVTLVAPQNVQGNFFTTDFRKEEVYTRTVNENYVLKDIISDHQKVSFTTKPRSDGGQVRVEAIRVYDLENPTVPIKSIVFDQGYFGNSAIPESCWLKLKSVIIQGEGTDAAYRFSYVNESFSFAISKEDLNIDHWGYFNNKNNTTLVPLSGTLQAQLQNQSNLGMGIVSWADRSSDFNSSKLFALEETQYPTKGYTKINYQSADGRGIRVASLEDFDGEHSVFRYYDYGSNFNWPAYYFPTEYYTFIDCGNPNVSRITTYGSSPVSPADYYSQSEAFYEDVIEYLGTPDGEAGRNSYKFQKFFAYGSEAKLIEKRSYKYGGNVIVSEEKYIYSARPLKTINYWLIPELGSLVTQGPTCNSDPDYRPSCAQTDPDKGYILGGFSGGTGSVDAVWARLDQLETTVDNIKSVKRFAYLGIDAETGHPKHTFPVSLEEDLSNGDVKKSLFHYPGESDPDNTSTILGLPQMWDPNNIDFKNLKSPVLKSETFVNNDLVSKHHVVYSYNATTGNLVIGSTENFPTGQAAGKILWTFRYDDKTNVINAGKEHDISKVIIWGYKGLYPIAEVENASFERVAYTSFEDDEYGGWSLIAGGNKNSGSPISGKKSYTGGIGKTVAPGDYVVTLWAKGNCTVNGVPGTQVRVSKRDFTWRYFEWKLTGVSSIQVAGDNIDEVRLYPANAQMMTYTYEPFIGVSTKTDLNNHSTYYEYDTYGRLYLIRDLDYNILKKYCYTFHGQTDECSAIVNDAPNWQPTSTTRCKPCPANNNYYLNILQRKFIDVNPNSASYNNELWTDGGSSTNCTPLADGQIVSSTCLKNISNENTGYQLQTVQYMNPCHELYGTTSTRTVYNSTSCPLPPPPPPPPSNCNFDNCAGEGYQCVNDQCELGIKVVTDRFWLDSYGQYEIIYHYEFSDGSWSQSYTEYE